MPHTTLDAPASIDAVRFRDVLSRYPSGLTVVSGHDDDGPIGFTCQSFYSVSLDPPLISFCVSTASTSYPRLRPSGSFAVNVLEESQSDLSRRFAVSGSEKWRDVEWTPSAAGNPLLRGTVAWLDCELWSEQEAGDHLIVVGRVRELVVCTEAEISPLVFYRATYHRLHALA